MRMGSQQASKFIFVRVVVVGAQIFLHIETIFDNEKIKTNANIKSLYNVDDPPGECVAIESF